MRTLKFRAWSISQHKMHDRVLAGPGDPCSIVWAEGHGWVQFDEPCGTIMQFTGLYDKHGKEVYEGDIVKAVLIENPGETVEEVIEEVQIHEGHLAPFYMRVNFEEDWWKDALQDGFEIIGNVHETPELLGDSIASSRRQAGEY